MFVALPAAHPLRHHAEPAPTDLAGECRLLPTADGGCWLALFRAAHESTPFTPAAVRELPYGRREVLDPVAPGLGAAPVPGSTAPVPGVAVRPLLGTPLWLRHVLLRRRAAIDPDLADTLSGAATAAYRELAGEAPPPARLGHPDVPPTPHLSPGPATARPTPPPCDTAFMV